MIEAIKSDENPSIKGNSHEQLFYNLEWLTAKEAALYLRILKDDGTPSEGAVRNLVYRNKLKAHKPNGRLLFRRRELDAFIEDSPVEHRSF